MRCQVAVFVLLCSLSIQSSFSASEALLEAPFSAEPSALLLAAADTETISDEQDTLVLLLEERFVVHEDGRVDRSHRTIYQVRSEPATGFGDEITAPWLAWCERRPKVRARVITKDGKEHQFDPRTLTETPIESFDNKVFTDSKILRGPLPAVQAEAVVETLIETEASQPIFEGGALIHSELPFDPVLIWRISVEHPKSVAVRHVLRGLPDVQPVREELESRVRLTLEFSRPKKRSSTFSLIPPNESGPYVAFSSWTSWGQTAAKYFRRVEEQLESGDELTLEIPAIEVSSSKEDVVNGILKRLHEEVRYTSVALGEAAIIPRSPDETLKRKYGDCKDKSALLIALLRQGGIEAQMALLRAGPGPDIDPQLPGFGLFNHAIVYVPALDMWIDPTDERARAGELPLRTQGRHALLIAPNTTGLVQTPASDAHENRLVHEQLYYLGDLGSMIIRDRKRASGSLERRLRTRFALGDSDRLEKRLASSYELRLAPTETLDVTDFTMTPVKDLENPFEVSVELVVETTAASRDRDTISVPVSVSTLVGWVPHLYTKGREVDFALSEPYTYELALRIVPPLGYQARALPKPTEKDLGIATFQSRFRLEESGAVSGNCRFELHRTRFSPQEAEGFAKELRDLRNASIEVWFDRTAELDLKAGRFREAIQAHRQDVKDSPDKALSRIRLALALLKAGFGESAREEALKATELEPDFMLAHQTLAQTLEHDLVGRRFARGFDHENAIKARRRAIELAPHDTGLREQLAYLLEYNATGARYGRGAELDEAIEIYQFILDPANEQAQVGITRASAAKKGRRQPSLTQSQTRYYRELLAWALMHAGRFEELRRFLEEVADNSNYFLRAEIAANAMTVGAAEAITRAAQAHRDERTRSENLSAAGEILAKMRHYGVAAALVGASATGSENSSRAFSRAEELDRMRRLEETSVSENDPYFVVKRFLVDRATKDDWLARLVELVSHHGISELNDETGRERFKKEGTSVWGASRAGLSRAYLADLSRSRQHLRRQGDDTTGYRFRLTRPVGFFGPARTHHYFVVKEEGVYRLLDFYESAYATTLAELGKEILERVGEGRLEHAKTLLDWALDVWRYSARAGPVARRSLHLFWTKQAPPEVKSMREAAAVLVMADRNAAYQIAAPILEGALRSSSSKEESVPYWVVLARLYRTAGEDEKSLEHGRKLLEEYPYSRGALQLVVSAMLRLGQHEELEALLSKRLEEDPEDATARRALVQSAMHSGDYATIRFQTRKLTELGEASWTDLNNLGVAALIADQVDDETHDTIQRAVGMTGGIGWALRHTQAALYAEVGRLGEAKEAVYRSMEGYGLEEPDGGTWYIFGRMAESCGLTDFARIAYQRVKEQEDELTRGVSTYAIARRKLADVAERRLAALESTPAKPE